MFFGVHYIYCIEEIEFLSDCLYYAFSILYAAACPLFCRL